MEDIKIEEDSQEQMRFCGSDVTVKKLEADVSNKTYTKAGIALFLPLSSPYDLELDQSWKISLILRAIYDQLVVI